MDFQTIRDEAFVEIARPLWIEQGSVGAPVVPLTWERYHHLLGECNPLVTGQAVTRAALRRALWQLSPRWQPTRASWLRYRLTHRLRRRDHARAITHIRAHIRAAFAESDALTPAPKGHRAAPGADSLPPVHLLAQIIHAFGTLYGWTRAESLRCPITVSFQLMIAARGEQPRTDGVPHFTAADRANGERLRQKRAQMRAARANTQPNQTK